MIAKVSIFMLAYNQEQYIEQTIDGVLMQKTNFNYELVIGEDCSTDNTRQICEDYKKKYPSKIKLLPSLNKNIGLIKNYIRTIKACDGKYIAICDGDDYWIDEYKLQKQVDFLEENPDFYIVGTNLKKLYSDGKIKKSVKVRTQNSYEFEDLIFENFLASVTVMFRNIPLLDPIPSWIDKFPYGDWPTYLWVIKDKGKIHKLEDVTAVYRSDVGVSAKIRNRQSDMVKVNFEIVECMASDVNFKHKKKVILKSLKKHNKGLIAAYNREKKYFKSFFFLIKTIIKHKQKFEFIKFYLYSLKQSF